MQNFPNRKIFLPFIILMDTNNKFSHTNTLSPCYMPYLQAEKSGHKYKMIFPLEMRVSTIACSHLKGVIPKMTESKLRSGINWQRSLNQKGTNQMRVNKG
jgi:hypothetical protein